MKKGFILVLLWLVLLSMPTLSKNENLNFVIENDSNASLSIIKKEIIDTINETLAYLDETSIDTYLSEDLHDLHNKKWSVSYHNHTLTFKVGDQKGVRITGSLARNEFCLVEVKPKSIIKEWLNL